MSGADPLSSNRNRKTARGNGISALQKLEKSKTSRTELLRENKRMLDKSMREIERERQGLQAQEKKLIVQINNTAKQGQMHNRDPNYQGSLGKAKVSVVDRTNSSCDVRRSR
ncbi:hypothetical protein Vadar_010202 [Vaccinium darrowii]|uniref:Uncharacterized protein n=1 Tax=Vaccinium darrowii TaxID=229202 RepID=A0ACB7YKQ3_9ERIC|nr:hypothetical protein Vadar_010202 [Vaccinium darrowii]